MGLIALERLKVTGLLSFGPQGVDLTLGALNILIGPNASGKSNLLETIGLLQASSKDIQATLREGGLPADWLWKARGRPGPEPAVVEALFPYASKAMRYYLRLAASSSGLTIDEERLENAQARPGATTPFKYFDVRQGHGAVTVSNEADSPAQRRLRPDNLNSSQSVLAQRRDPDVYPEITFVSDITSKMRIYRDWQFGRTTPPRWPQKPDLPGDVLAEDASNLALVLNHGQRTGLVDKINHVMQELYDQVVRVTTITEYGGVQVYVEEHGGIMPATRLSDGTLRMLCLSAILCHPSPPPLVCIEEPEIGLHPDAIAIVARLLESAAETTQIIVTTHSEELVSALTHRPEDVIVCDPSADGTTMRRLDGARLSEWLTHYQLGQLWRNGELGGTRW